MTLLMLGENDALQKAVFREAEVLIVALMRRLKIAASENVSAYSRKRR